MPMIYQVGDGPPEVVRGRRSVATHAPDIQRLTDAFAGEVERLVRERVDQVMKQVNDAFEAALSAFASELLSSTSTVSAVEDSPRPTKRSKGRPRPAKAKSLAAGNVVEPHRVPEGIRDADAVDVDTSRAATTDQGGEVADAAAKQTPPATDGAPVSEVATSSTHRRSSDPTAKRICGCAARGRHRKECSLPNVSTSPASVPAGPPRPAVPPSLATSPIPTRADRFAQIEESKRKREALVRDRAERAASFARKEHGVPASLTDEDQVAFDLDGLPVPRTTFEV